LKNHAWRPFLVVIVLVALFLTFRYFYVPRDFGVQEQGYMYGFHRLSNEKDWKEFPVSYKFDKGNEYCKGCHEDKVTSLLASPHKMIPCEDCHGPALNHPDNPAKLQIDRRRDLCLRCHSDLPYPGAGRNVIPGIDPFGHNPGVECVSCHNPHNVSLEGMK
jgi:Cytochrome c3